MVRNNYKEGTIIEGADKIIKETDEVTLYTSTDAVSSSQIRFDPDFKAYLTFFIHKNIPITNLDYFISLNTPLNGENGERKIIPVSHSIDLVSKLKRTDKDSILSNGPAKIKIIRYESSQENRYGLEIKNLYENFALDRRIDSLFYDELKGFSREQFEIAVPKSNPSIINILNPESKVEFYSVIRFSDKYTSPPKGIFPGRAKRGKIVEIKKEDLIKPNDKVVFGFGHFIGLVDETNPKRRFLMYITPNELIPKL